MVIDALNATIRPKHHSAISQVERVQNFKWRVQCLKWYLRYCTVVQPIRDVARVRIACPGTLCL